MLGRGLCFFALTESKESKPWGPGLELIIAQRAWPIAQELGRLWILVAMRSSLSALLFDLAEMIRFFTLE